jgi:hypothetical protein
MPCLVVTLHHTPERVVIHLASCLACVCSADSLTAGLPSFGGLWSVAKAVQSAVKQTTNEVVRSVQQTDWKSELAAFTQEVEAEAQKVSHKAVEVVQQLPAQLHTRTSEVRSSQQLASLS